MLPPTAVVAVQMDALQINDWPDPDSGIRTAFLFSKPYDCESMIAGRVRPPPTAMYPKLETRTGVVCLTASGNVMYFGPLHKSLCKACSCK